MKTTISFFGILGTACVLSLASAKAETLNVPKGTTVNVEDTQSYTSTVIANTGAQYGTAVLNVLDGGNLTTETLLIGGSSYGHQQVYVKSGGILNVTSASFTQSTGTGKIFVEANGTLMLDTVSYTGNRTSTIEISGNAYINSIANAANNAYKLTLDVKNGGYLSLGESNGYANITLSGGTLELSSVLNLNTIDVTSTSSTILLSDSMINAIMDQESSLS